MNVDVNQIKDSFLNRINDLYNQEVFFIATCYKFPSKYSLENSAMDENLRIFFEENNKIILCDKVLKYCDKDSNRHIKLANISEEVGTPDINIINNYIIEDRWNQIDW